MCRRLIVCLAMSLVALGCETKPAPSPEGDAVASRATSLSPAPEDEAPQAPPLPLPARQMAGAPLGPASMRALMQRLGCPQDQITDVGCEVCPEKLHPGARPYETPYARELEWHTPGAFQMKPPRLRRRTMHAFSGRFAALDGREGVFLQYGGCPARGADRGERAAPRPVVALVERDKARGELLVNADTARLESCTFPRRADGAMHILCVVVRERGALITADVTGLSDAARPERDLGAQIDGLASYETRGREVITDHDAFFKHDPQSVDFGVIAVEDVDGDGDEDLRIQLGPRAHVLVQGPRDFVARP